MFLQLEAAWSDLFRTYVLALLTYFLSIQSNVALSCFQV